MPCCIERGLKDEKNITEGGCFVQMKVFSLHFHSIEVDEDMSREIFLPHKKSHSKNITSPPQILELISLVSLLLAVITQTPVLAEAKDL